MKLKRLIHLFFTCILSLQLITAQDTWEQKTSFSGDKREGAIAFVIDGKVYAGTRYNTDDDYVADMSVYDPQTDSWTPIDTFPGEPRFHAATFVIGNKGYLISGKGSSSTFKTDVWEFDPVSNLWTEKGAFPDAGRSGSASFAINGKGYVGCGFNSDGLLNDFWEYDPLTDTWTERASYPGIPRMWTFKFALNGKGYIGLGGELFATFNKDLYEYDPLLNTWSEKAEFPFEAMGLVATFVIDDIAYLVTGMIMGDYFTDFVFAYDPVLDSWETKDFFDGSRRHHSNGFTIGNKGYTLFGHELFGFDDQMWEYTPDDTVNSIQDFETEKSKAFPNPSSGTYTLMIDQNYESIHLYDQLGNQLAGMEVFEIGNNQLQINLDYRFPNGNYFLKLHNNEGNVTIFSLVKAAAEK